jgi:hypothetical protein
MLPAWMQLVLFDRVALFGLREFVLTFLWNSVLIFWSVYWFGVL